MFPVPFPVPKLARHSALCLKGDPRTVAIFCDKHVFYKILKVPWSQLRKFLIDWTVSRRSSDDTLSGLQVCTYVSRSGEFGCFRNGWSATASPRRERDYIYAITSIYSYWRVARTYDRRLVEHGREVGKEERCAIDAQRDSGDVRRVWIARVCSAVYRVKELSWAELSWAEPNRAGRVVRMRDRPYGRT